MLRRMFAIAAVFSLALPAPAVLAAGKATRTQGQQVTTSTGTIKGTAKDSKGAVLAHHTVRARDVSNGALAGSTTSDTAGNFTIANLPAGTYAIEIVNDKGDIVATTAALTLAAGATVTVSVVSAAAIAAGVAAATGGAFFASTLGIVTLAAVGAGVTGAVIAANKSNASPSR